MSKLSDFTKAISDRLTAVAAQPGSLLAGITVLTEDAADLETKINKAIEELGLLILIGQPVLENVNGSLTVANMKISSAIAIGENPTLWRDDPLTKPVCLDIVEAVTAALQGFAEAGFEALRVIRADFIPDKKRQLYELTIETQYPIDATT